MYSCKLLSGWAMKKEQTQHERVVHGATLLYWQKGVSPNLVIWNRTWISPNLQSVSCPIISLFRSIEKGCWRGTNMHAEQMRGENVLHLPSCHYSFKQIIVCKKKGSQKCILGPTILCLFQTCFCLEKEHNYPIYDNLIFVWVFSISKSISTNAQYFPSLKSISTNAQYFPSLRASPPMLSMSRFAENLG
jgi:hypothetical protein